MLPLEGIYFSFYLIASFNIASASDKRFKDLEINTKLSKKCAYKHKLNIDVIMFKHLTD